jgi:hypothetical protein
MSEGEELYRTAWAELSDGREIAMFERIQSHDTYVTISHPDGMPPDMYEFPNEDSAEEFYKGLTRTAA